MNYFTKLNSNFPLVEEDKKKKVNINRYKIFTVYKLNRFK